MNNLIDTNNRSKKLISICVPILDEASNIQKFYERLVSLADKMKSECQFEFIFSDNHSTDGSWPLLVELSKNDPRIKAIRFSRNFGFQRSILANYMHARGDAIMQIDADLQDPPELLETFYDLWRQGYHVVYGVREWRQENLLMDCFRRIGYWLINKFSEHHIPRNAGDFRLIDRMVVNELIQTRSLNPYIRGIIAGLGFKQIGICYERKARAAGKSKFNFMQLLSLGVTAIFNHSNIPFRAAFFFGGFAAGLIALLILYPYGLHMGQSSSPGSITFLFYLLLLFGIGLNIIFLGIIGEYILQIYRVLSGEKLAIIVETLNLESSEIKL